MTNTPHSLVEIFQIVLSRFASGIESKQAVMQDAPIHLFFQRCHDSKKMADSAQDQVNGKKS